MRMHQVFGHRALKRRSGRAARLAGDITGHPAQVREWNILEQLESRTYLTVIGSPDVYNAQENMTLVVDGTTLSGVLANDTTGTTPASRAVVASQPQHGALAFNNNGTFSYTPNPNFHGVDSFTYVAQVAPTPAALINATTHPWRWLHPTNGQNPSVTDPDFHTTWYLSEGDPLVPNFPGVGSGRMGYGAFDDGIAVSTNIGLPAAGARYTAYFRTTFEFPGDPSSLTGMTMTTLVDDGAYFYFNGQLISTFNMPSGAPDTYTGFASNAPAEARSTIDLFAQIPNLASRLVQGTNTLAVSIHNTGADSSDLGLDLALNATFSEQSTPVTVTLNVEDSLSPPVGTPDSYVMVEGGSLQVQPASGLLANDGELAIDQGMLLSIQPPANLPAGAVFTPDVSTGTFSLNLAGAPDFFGAINFSYILEDIHGQSAPVPVTVYVTNINDAPLAIVDPAPGQAYLMDQGTIFTSGVSGAQTSIFPMGSLWSYDDSGTDLHTRNPNWNDLGFNPSNPGNGSPAWNSGVSPLGYPTAVGGTIMSFGPDAANKYPTYYFRKNFNLADASAFNAAAFNLFYDDGAVVYINGVEVYRENMPGSTIAHSTLAPASGNATVARTFFIPQGVLVNGDNVIAVEVHQATLGSSDIAFNMSLSLFKTSGVIDNDQDSDSAGLTAFIVSQPSHGLVVMDSLGNFTYTPHPNYFGADLFIYRTVDGHGALSNPGFVAFNVQQVETPPVPADDVYTIPEGGLLDTAALGGGLLANDQLGRPITGIEVVQPPDNGATFQVPPGLDGHFILVPADPEFSGVVSFTYRLTDAVGTGPAATVTINVTPVNDRPVAVNDPDTPGAYSTVQGAPFSSQGILDLVANRANWRYLNITDGVDPSIADTDFNTTWFRNDGSYNGPAFAAPSPAPFHAGGVDGLTGGTVLVTPPSGLRYTSYYTTTFEFSGNPAEVSRLTASILVDDGMALYLNGTPVGRQNFTANDTFTATSQGTISETTIVNVDLVNALMMGTNYLAVSVHQANNTSSDFGFDLSLRSFAQVGYDLLDNDFDIDSPAASLTAILGAQPSNGSVVLQSNGHFNYTPKPNFIGDDTFTYFANDGQISSLNPAVVTVRVTDGNRPPVLMDVFNLYSVNEDQTLDTLTLGGAGSVYRNAGLMDANGVAFDPILSVSVDVSATWGQVQFDPDTGHFTFTPPPDFTGNTTFTYQVSDKDGASNIGRVTIQVVPVNDPPVAADDFYQVFENTSISQYASLQAIPRVSSWFYEDSGVNLHSVASNWNQPGFNPQTPAAGPVWKSGVGKFGFGDPAATTLSDFDQTTFYFRKNFNLTDEQAVGFDLLRLNVLRDDGVVIYLNGVEVLRSNMPLGPIQYSTLASVAVDGADETIYVPFTVDLRDLALFPGGNPLLAGDNVIAVELHQITATNSDVGFDLEMTLAAPGKGLLANDGDIDSATLTARLFSPPQFGVVAVAADGSFTYTPFGNYSGPDSFRYFASDGMLNSLPATVHINVIDVPGSDLLAWDDSYSMYEDTTLMVSNPSAGIMANEVGHLAGLSIIYDELTDGPAHGMLALNLNDGTFTYVPDENFAGVDMFTYRVTDGTRISEPATVSITVINIIDVPIALPDDYPSYFAQEGGAPFDSAAAGAPSLLANDPSPDAVAFTAALLGADPGGSVVVNPDGSFIFTPSPNFHGDYHFEYLAQSAPIRLIERGGRAAAPVGQHVWRYLDNGTNPGPAWNAPGYDDSGWGNGVGEFGYGDGDERTVVGFVDVDPSTPATIEKNATTFFRSSFRVQNAAEVKELIVNTVWDDGIAVYINGQEVFRQLLGPDAAFDEYGSFLQIEGVFVATRFTITPGMLIDGDNVIAVEVHQSSGTSSDISFDLELDAIFATSALATVHVQPWAPNRPPVGVQDAFFGDEDVPLAGNVLLNEFGPGLTVNLFAGMPESIGQVVLNPDGSFVFTPAPDFNSSHLPAEQYPGDPNAAVHFFYTITRDFGEGVQLTSEPVPVRLTINPLPDAPIGSPDLYQVEPGAAFTAGVSSSVFDLVLRGGTANLPIGGQVWSYLDDGSDPGYFWNKLGFDDSAWGSGVGEFGYGDGDERALVGFVDVDPVTPGVQRNATTYFRTYFNLDDPGAVAQLMLSVLADDGVAVYLNGREVFRNNLAPGAAFDAYALADIGVEGIFLNSVIVVTPGMLRAGLNLIAVEVHQDSSASVDMSMDLGLRALVIASNSGVLANDFDPDHQTITATLVTPPQFHDSQGGTAPFVLNADGSFTYLRLAGVFGDDFFTYIATDGVNSSAPITVQLTTPRIPGDLNGDHVLSADDIDALFAHIRDSAPYDPAFDQDDNGVVNQQDVERLVTGPDLLNTFFGDANLNGATSLGDLVILATNYDQPGGWAKGDFSGNGIVSLGDLVILAEHFDQQRAGELTGDSSGGQAGGQLVSLDALGLLGTGDSDEEVESDGQAESPADILEELGQELRG